ncbi:MAG: TetR/AcrR family transcriptional regulator [Alphaproteobacteria bacterium]|nr:TetR/AcrR family transcriptional regulator [Alphaproteobacteria bacterium]
MARVDAAVPAVPADASPKRAARLKGPARTQAIVEAAAALFAEAGFSASTRELAKRLGVTQALLYRFFPSKQALIDAVFEHVFQARLARRWDGLLDDRTQPLPARLKAFYLAYVNWTDPTGMRLFVRAGLDGMALTGVRGATLTDQIFAPIIAELRRQAALPTLDEAPLMRGERELCMALHGAVVFLAIRRHVYGLPTPDDVSAVVGLLVDTFVAGAPVSLSALHKDGPASLRLTQLRPRPRSAKTPRE